MRYQRYQNCKGPKFACFCNVPIPSERPGERFITRFAGVPIGAPIHACISYVVVCAEDPLPFLFDGNPYIECTHPLNHAHRTSNHPNNEFVNVTTIVVPVSWPLRQIKQREAPANERGVCDHQTKRLEEKRYDRAVCLPSREPKRLFSLAHATPISDSTSSPSYRGCVCVCTGTCIPQSCRTCTRKRLFVSWVSHLPMSWHWAGCGNSAPYDGHCVICSMSHPSVSWRRGCVGNLNEMI